MKAVWLVAVGVVLAGCVAGPTLSGDAIPVRVLVTQGFGNRTLVDETVRVGPGSSALGATVQAADVETAYGGGFVTAIEGVDSRYPDRDLDWFYAVDGLYPPVGARQRTVHAGDVVHWDHHDWTHLIDPGGTLVSGAVPEGPAVVGPDRVADEAGGRPVDAPTPGPLVVVAASNASLLDRVHDRPHALGLFVHADEGFAVHGPDGAAVDRDVRAHVALVPNPWGGPDDPMLLIEGRSRDDAVDAWTALRSRDGTTAHAYVLVDDALQGVPP